MNKKIYIFLLLGFIHCAIGNEEESKENEPITKQKLPLFTKFDPDESINLFSRHQLIRPPVTRRVLPRKSNVTINADKNETATSTPEEIICLRGVNNGTTVQLVNDTELLKILAIEPKATKDKKIPALCVVAMFYSKNCPFSKIAAPFFNALPRAFPDVKMVAMNSMMNNLFNTQNGIVGVPMLLFFYNGKAIYRYNNTEYNFESFISFLSESSNITPVSNVTVTPEDYLGPVICHPGKNPDMFLIVSWIFIIVCAFYYFSKSKLLKWIIETIQRDWRESEQHIQHEHVE